MEWGHQGPRNGVLLTWQWRLVGIGFMLRHSDQVMVALDYTRVGYSELRAFAQSFANSSKANNFVLRNGNEFHVGLEYALSNLRLRYVPAARVGMWYDPEHAARYDSPPAVDIFDSIYAAALPGNRSQVHFAAGGGVSISQHLNRLEIDAPVDFSTAIEDRSPSGTRPRRRSMSAIIRF